MATIATLACGCSTVQKEKNTYELALVGVRFCAYALISFLSCRYYNIFKQLFQVFPTSIYSIVVCKIYLDRGSCRSAAGEFTYKCIPTVKKNMIKDGKSNYEILEDNPNYMMQLEKVERCREMVAT